MPGSVQNCVTEHAVADFMEQKRNRVGFDGRSYTEKEFREVHEASGEDVWETAPHYATLAEFQKEWGVNVVRYNEPPSSSAERVFRSEFGVLFPTVLVLCELRHLQGKLRNCRLAPENRKAEEIWTSGIVIGMENCVGERIGSIYVADMREDVFGDPDLVRMGRWAHAATAVDFIRRLEDESREEKRNVFMDFLCVDGNAVESRACTRNRGGVDARDG